MSEVKNEVSEFCDQHNACREGKEWAVTNTTLADVFDNCQRGDWMMWMLRRAGKIDKPTAVKLACEFALRVLPIYEKKYSRKEPRLAIEAALAWVNDQTEEKKRAAAAAAAAAYAAYASAAATAAAYAASAAAAYAASAAAADAAAAAAAAYDDSASAAADAADAVYAAADAARQAARTSERQAQAELIRKTVGNPWRFGI
jgi:type IV secretory pathway VirB6-like protein